MKVLRLSDLLTEIASRHAVHLEGLKTGYVREFERFLQAMQDDLVAQLSRVEDPASLTGRRLTRLLEAVQETLRAGFDDYAVVWREQIEALARYEGEFTVRALERVVDAQFVLPTPVQLITAAFTQPLHVEGVDGGKLLEPFYRDWTGKTFDRVTGAIRLAAAQGQSTPDLVRRLRGTRAAKYRDGILQQTRRDVTLMARTALQHVASQARAETYRQNKKYIKMERFVAVLDGRTSVLCRSLSDREFPVGEGPIPPLHIVCRSVRVPVLDKQLKALEAGGEQFSRGPDGKPKFVDADLSYYEWLKTQPASFQDSVVGETRGKLLRNGGISATRFAELQLDKDFRPLTLDQMRELEPVAFERAGI